MQENVFINDEIGDNLVELGHSERFIAVASSSPDAIINIDSTGKIVFWNPAAEKMFGHLRSEVLGKSINIIVPDAFVKQHSSRMSRYFETEEGTHIGTTVPLVAKRKDGFEFPMELSMSSWKMSGSTYVTGIIRDVTEKVKTEEALKESEEKFRSIYENSAVGIAKAKLDGTIEYCNKALENILGYSEKELRQMSIKEITHPDDWEPNKWLIDDAQKGNRDSYQLEKRYIRKDGSETWGNLKASIVKDADNKPSFLVATLEDITKRKTAKKLSDALNEINAAISSTLDFDKIIQHVVIEAAKVIECDSSVIILKGDHVWETKYVSGTLPDTFIGHKFDDRQISAIMSSQDKQPTVGHDYIREMRLSNYVADIFKFHSYMAIPLGYKEQTIGVLLFINHTTAEYFGSEKIDFAAKLGTSVSLAIENSRLYFIEKSVSNTLQNSLLTVPEVIEGLDFDHFYKSATTENAKVGGDFYDLYELPRDKVGLVMGDVSGKGLEAAVLTSLVKNSIKAYSYQHRSPHKIMELTNKLVLKSSPEAVYVSVFFAILEKTSGKLRYCCAGHPPPIIKKAGETTMLDTCSSAIGVINDFKGEDREISIDEGDQLIIYTDGVTEARRDKDFFQEKRLIEIIKGAKKRLSSENIFNEVNDFTCGHLSDDVAILTISLNQK